MRGLVALASVVLLVGCISNDTDLPDLPGVGPGQSGPPAPPVGALDVSDALIPFDTGAKEIVGPQQDVPVTPPEVVGPDTPCVGSPSYCLCLEQGHSANYCSCEETEAQFHGDYPAGPTLYCECTYKVCVANPDPAYAPLLGICVCENILP